MRTLTVLRSHEPEFTNSSLLYTRDPGSRALSSLVSSEVRDRDGVVRVSRLIRVGPSYDEGARTPVKHLATKVLFETLFSELDP